MNDHDIPPEMELESLRNRVSVLAGSNAHLKLVNRMLTSLTSVTGLDNTAQHILQILMETIGSANIILFYTINGTWHSTDIYGISHVSDELSYPLAIRAIRDQSFACSRLDNLPETPPGMPVETWAFPLYTKDCQIGAVVMEGMQLPNKAICAELQPFFVYAALMLNNEISNYSLLADAHWKLKSTNQELQQEVEARRAAEAQYRALFEHSPDGIILIDPATMKFANFNEAAHSQLGYTRDEFSNLTVHDIEAMMDDSAIAMHVKVILENGSDRFETLHRSKAGEILNVVVMIRRIILGARVMLLGIFHDVTESRKMEEELLKSQKLESVSVLAGGIAHDFNNLLTAILGNMSLAKMLLNPDMRPYELLLESEKACLRAKDLTQQLLTFSKGGLPIKKLSAIGEVVRESARFAIRGSNILCEFEIPDLLWQAEIDEGQISQVIHNLVINAEQAMPMGGSISVRCENCHASMNKPAGLDPGDYVKISIRDHGIGIPKELLQKIFDPFFTTKQYGSGLGLATSYSIIRKHDGHVEVESTPGIGTTFKLYLPADTRQPVKREEAATSFISRKLRILIMDDEEMIREILGTMLTEMGHEVELSGDGGEAVEKYQREIATGKAFDCVILDLTVPGGMGGKDALRELRQIDQGVKALVSSGYANDVTLSDYKAFGFGGMLAKPYSFEGLRRALAEMNPFT